MQSMGKLDNNGKSQRHSHSNGKMKSSGEYRMSDLPDGNRGHLILGEGGSSGMEALGNSFMIPQQIHL